MDLISIIFLLLSLVIINAFTFILLKFHSSIINIKRNILTYLNSFLVIIINALVNLKVRKNLIKTCFPQNIEKMLVKFGKR